MLSLCYPDKKDKLTSLISTFYLETMTFTFYLLITLKFLLGTF